MHRIYIGICGRSMQYNVSQKQHNIYLRLLERTAIFLAADALNFAASSSLVPRRADTGYGMA